MPSERTATTEAPAEIAVVFGTRPEAIKMAPLVQALDADARFRPRVVLTGQHREMVDQVLALFGIEPDVDLAIMQQGQTLAGITGAAVQGLDQAFEKLDPDMVAVQGDTSTTMCGALAAFYRQIPVAHLEAGLRSGNPYSPFPEEINRRMTSQLATLHLAPTERAVDALLAEGVDPSRVVRTGNTVIDALQWVQANRKGFGTDALRFLDEDDRPMILVTAHRRESWGDGMAQIGGALAEVATRHPELTLVFPIHRNPLVREQVLPPVAGLDNVVVTEPVDYVELVALLDRCRLVLTDSGGIQEEAPGLGKPVLVMRDTTERPEGVAAGVARLVGTDRARIVDEVERLVSDPAAYAGMANAVNPYGDGTAAVRTVEAMAATLGLTTDR
ncbi:MAG: non-hydrolyzing UDP-N-acetylglucosamine 2-epimerase [Acidimicrobiales bacterium]